MLPMLIEDGIDRGGVDVDVGLPMLATTFPMFITMSQTIYKATESVGLEKPYQVSLSRDLFGFFLTR